MRSARLGSPTDVAACAMATSKRARGEHLPCLGMLITCSWHRQAEMVQLWLGFEEAAGLIVP